MNYFDALAQQAEYDRRDERIEAGRRLGLDGRPAQVETIEEYLERMTPRTAEDVRLTKSVRVEHHGDGGKQTWVWAKGEGWQRVDAPKGEC